MADKPKRHGPPDLEIGPMPVEAINRVLGYDLDPGTAVFSTAAQLHANRQHPAEYPKCLPHIGQVVLTPMFLGDDFANSGKIELISKVRGVEPDVGILVAISIEITDGKYQIASVYPISQRKIEGRLQKGFLKRV